MVMVIVAFPVAMVVCCGRGGRRGRRGRGDGTYGVLWGRGGREENDRLTERLLSRFSCCGWARTC